MATIDPPARLFTVDEANAILPDLLPVIAAMRDDAAALRGLRGPLAQLAERAESCGGIRPSRAESNVQSAASSHLQAVERAVAELTAIGVYVRNAERGLIDFPSQRNGEIVDLCWVYGEDSVQFWHPADEDYSARKPL